MSVETDSEYQSVFTPSPMEVFSEANVLIRVTDASVIRPLGGTIITFDVRRCSFSNSVFSSNSNSNSNQIQFIA